jgi:hypothetical protein
MRPTRISQGWKISFDRRRPRFVISRGRLCPKGSDSFELLTRANGQTPLVPRQPNEVRNQILSAMDIAIVPGTLERTFVEEKMERS